MDNIGSGVGTIILAIEFLLLAFRTITALLIIYYLSKQLMSTTSRILGYESKLTGNSRYDFFTYLVTWLFIAPIISGLFETLIRELIRFASYRENFGSFGYLNFYLLGLTTWCYDSNLEKFQLRPIGIIVYRGIIFLVLAFILNIVSDSIDIFNSPISIYLVIYVLSPTAFGLLTIYYLRKNRLPSYP